MLSEITEIDVKQLAKDAATYAKTEVLTTPEFNKNKVKAKERILEAFKAILDSESTAAIDAFFARVKSESALLNAEKPEQAVKNLHGCALAFCMETVLTHSNVENAACVINHVCDDIFQVDPKFDSETALGVVLDNKIKFSAIINKLSDTALTCLMQSSEGPEYLLSGILIDEKSSDAELLKAFEIIAPKVLTYPSRVRTAVNYLLSKDILGETDNFKKHYVLLCDSGFKQSKLSPSEFLLVYSANRNSPEISGLLANFLNDMTDRHKDNFDAADFLDGMINHRVPSAGVTFTSFVEGLSGKVNDEVVETFIDKVKASAGDNDKLIAAINHLEIIGRQKHTSRRSAKI